MLRVRLRGDCSRRLGRTGSRKWWRSPPSPPPAMSLAGRTSLPSRRRYTCSNCSESRIVGLLATAAKTAYRHSSQSPPSPPPAMPMNVWRTLVPKRPRSCLSRPERRRVGPTPTFIADSALALEHYSRVISSGKLIFKLPTIRWPCCKYANRVEQLVGSHAAMPRLTSTWVSLPHVRALSYGVPGPSQPSLGGV